MKWLPIESAPKDGTPILCYWPEWANCEPWGCAFGVAYWSYGEWRDPDDELAISPTMSHWMPLPEPPNA